MAEDAGLLAELLADSQIAPNNVCSVCTWLQTQPNAAIWDKAFRDEQIRPAAIFRKMKTLGFTKTKAPVENHRRAGHRA